MFFEKNLVPDIFKKAFNELRSLVLELAADGSNAELFYCPVSPAENKSFCRNEAGWPRNDIDLFINMENQKVASEILSRLEEIPSEGFPIDENPDSIRLSLMSKYQQTESEVTNWIEQQIEFKEIEQERQRLDEESKLNVEQRQKALREFTDNLSSEERDIWLKAKRQRLIDEMLEVDSKK